MRTEIHRLVLYRWYKLYQGASADGRRASESQYQKDVQLGLFATKAGQMSPTIDTYCEFIDVTSRYGEVLKTDQDVLNDAFKDVVEYLAGRFK